MVIEHGVVCTTQLLVDCSTHKDCEDPVLDGVDLAFVKGKNDEGTVHEVLILQQRLEETLGPTSGNFVVRVMAVVGLNFKTSQSATQLDIERHISDIVKVSNSPSIVNSKRWG